MKNVIAGPALATVLAITALTAACAGPHRGQSDGQTTDRHFVDALGQPLEEWPCGDGTLPPADAVQAPAALVNLLEAFETGDSRTIELAGQDLLASAIEASRRQFHSHEASDTQGDRGRSNREFLETWVYGPVPVLRVGVDRFWLDERLAIQLATSAIANGAIEDARFWLMEAGAPAFLDDYNVRCLAWIDLQGPVERLDGWAGQVDWQGPGLRPWEDRVRQVIDHAGGNGQH